MNGASFKINYDVNLTLKRDVNGASFKINYDVNLTLKRDVKRASFKINYDVNLTLKRDVNGASFINLILMFDKSCYLLLRYFISFEIRTVLNLTNASR